MQSPTRALLAATALALAASSLTACSSDDSKDGSSSAGASGGGAFPATVKNKFGTTTVKSKPKRIAVVGYNDQDWVFAFGGKPVLMRNWGAQPVVQPWAKSAAGDIDVKGSDLGQQSIDIEKVAASKPDLIVGVYSGMTKADYDKLSKIAPVVAQEDGFIDYGQPWQNTTRDIGTAMGQPDKAKQLISDIEAKFAKAKSNNPQWSGKSLAVATFDGKNQLSSFASGDARSRFFQSLGFSTNKEIDKLAGDKFYTTIPLEKANLVDQDVLVWDQLSYTQGGKDAVKKNASLANLKAMRDNRAIYLEPQDVQSAFGWGTVLSLPYAIEHIEPMLQKVAPKK